MIWMVSMCIYTVEQDEATVEDDHFDVTCPSSRLSPLLIIMSLLTVCRQTAARQSLSRTATLALRYNSNSNSNSSDIPKKLEHASSAITPAPVTKDVLVADVISGAPCTSYTVLCAGNWADNDDYLAELRHRSVRIFQPTRNTMQSGSAKGTKWRIDFDILQGAGRWENPLMGWASS